MSRLVHKILCCWTLLIFIAGSSAEAQEKIRIPVKGVAAEVEKKLLEHDIIPSGRGLNNLTLRLKNEGSRGWNLNSGNIYDVQYDPATKHYDMEGEYFDIRTQSEHYTLDKPVIIRVIAYTSFENCIWTEVRRTPENLTDPIIFDQYSAVEGKPDQQPFYKIKLKGKRFKPALSEALLTGDDPAGGQCLTVQMRNVGQEQYACTSQGIIYGSKDGQFFTKAALNDHIDPAKPIELMVSIKTVFGNAIWGIDRKDLTNMRKGDFHFTNYSGTAGDPVSPLRDTPPEGSPALSEATGSAIPQSTKAEAGSANTFRFGQHQGTLAIAKLPDSVAAGNLKSRLETDGTISVGFQEIALKGGMPIHYNMSAGYVLMAHANGDQTLKTEYGEVTIKDNTPLEFSKYRVTGLLLSENTTLETDYGSFVALAGADEYDLQFHDDGKLREATLAQPATLTVGSRPFDVPEGSKLLLDHKGLTGIAYSRDTGIELGGTAYTMRGSTDKPSIQFERRSGLISRILVASGHSVQTNDGPLKVEACSYVDFEYDDGRYCVHMFVIGEERTIKQYKRNGKVKEKRAKTGKRITLEEDRVTKVSF